MDFTSRLLLAALGGLSTRQRVIADNIANVDTPGFTPTAVEFEDALRAAIARREAASSPLVRAANPAGAAGARQNSSICGLLHRRRTPRLASSRVQAARRST